MRPPELSLPGRTVTLAAETGLADGLSDQLLEIRAGVDEADLAIRVPGEDWRVLPAADAASRRACKRMFFSGGSASAVFGWLVSQQPAGDRATVALTFQIHEFAGDLRLVDPLELGIDDKLVEELRRSRRVGPRSSASDAIAWLEARFLMATGTDSAWAVGTFGDRRALNLHASDSTADLASSSSGSR